MAKDPSRHSLKSRKYHVSKYADSPELFEQALKWAEAAETYMDSDDIPSADGLRKSRMDDVGSSDSSLGQKMIEHDFLRACQNGIYDEVKMYVRRYKKTPYSIKFVNCTDDEGFTGLDYACLYMHPKIEKYLLKNGAVETEHTREIREQVKNTHPDDTSAFK